jgi:polar amino acid transport system substrate-binding protein
MRTCPTNSPDGRLGFVEEQLVSITRRSMATLTFVAIFVAGCGAGGSPSPTQGAPSAAAGSPAATTVSIPPPTSLISAGKLVDCVDIEYPPLEFFATTTVTDPNAAVGFDVDAAKKVASLLGLTITIKNTGFEALIPDLQAGRCDIVWSGLYVSAKRTAVADASPYFATGQTVMVPAGNPKNIKSATDLCGLSVSIQSGGLVETRIRQASMDCTTAGKAAITIQGYPKVADELQQIVLGRVDAVWETQEQVADFENKNPGKYETAYALPKDDPYDVYTLKGKADIAAAIAAALKALKADGSLAAIATQYHLDPANLDVIK